MKELPLINRSNTFNKKQKYIYLFFMLSQVLYLNCIFKSHGDSLELYVDE